MQHPFDTHNLDANSFNAYEDEFLASISSVFAQNPQDPTYATPEVAVDQHLTWTPYAAAGDPSSMISPAGFHNQVQRSFSAIAMPKLVANVGGVALGRPPVITRGGNMHTPNMELGLQIQPTPSISMPTRTTHSAQRYSPISGSASGSESGSSARALPASKPYSRRRTSLSRQATTGTPSASDEDHDALSLANMTEKEREAQKRRQNAQASSRARRRRVAEAARMQEDVARLQREVNVWRERTRMLEGIAAQAGIVIPRSPDDI